MLDSKIGGAGAIPEALTLGWLHAETEVGRNSIIAGPRLGRAARVDSPRPLLPEHLVGALEGITREIEIRAFEPLLAAATYDLALERSKASVVAFAELWIAAVGALTPLLAQQPSLLQSLPGTDNVWASGRAERLLGRRACRRFAEADEIREELVTRMRALRPQSLAPEPRPAERNLLQETMLADFGLLFGHFVLSRPTDPKLAPGLIDFFAGVAWSHVREARNTLLSIERGEDREGDELRRRFERLAHEWMAQTVFESSTTKLTQHPAYREIVGMGRAAIPFLLREMEIRPGHWDVALAEIAGENPVPAKDRGQVQATADAWLHWGRDRGLTW